jgi:hypothetical protein
MPGARPTRIIAAVSPLLLLALGLVVLAIGFVMRRSLGARYRVGTLLSAAPVVTVAEGKRPPVRRDIQGPVTDSRPTVDDAHRPLVFRRTRLQPGTDRDGST